MHLMVYYAIYIMEYCIYYIHMYICTPHLLYLNGKNFKWLTWGERAIKWRDGVTTRRHREECRLSLEETGIAAIRTHVGT